MICKKNLNFYYEKVIFHNKYLYTIVFRERDILDILGLEYSAFICTILRIRVLKLNFPRHSANNFIGTQN